MKNILLDVEENIKRVVNRVTEEGKNEVESIYDEELFRDFTEEELGTYAYRTFTFRYLQFIINYTITNDCDIDAEDQIYKVIFDSFIK